MLKLHSKGFNIIVNNIILVKNSFNFNKKASLILNLISIIKYKDFKCKIIVISIILTYKRLIIII